MNEHDELTGIECPFCGHEIEYLGLFCCDNCAVTWPSKAAIERDRPDRVDMLEDEATR